MFKFNDMHVNTCHGLLKHSIIAKLYKLSANDVNELYIDIYVEMVTVASWKVHWFYTL